MKIRDVLAKIAKQVDGTVRSDYSGRFMFGARCYGIETPDLVACIMEAGRHGLPKPNQDAMGLDYIVYWPEFDESAVQQEARPARND